MNTTNADGNHTPGLENNINSQCRLLILPAELRNRIYGYVFTITFEDPYIARHCNDILHLSKDAKPPRLYESLNPRSAGGFNQLKYVCRFLNHETSFLEVEHNIIKLSRSENDREGPAERFSTFVDGCPASKAQMIKNVILDNDAMTWKTPTIEEPRHFLGVAAFCRLHPDVKVKYIPNQMAWNMYSVHNVIELGVLINLLVRGVEVRPIVSPHAGSESEFEFKYSSFRLWFDAKDVAQSLNVPNLRFWPLQGSSGFDEEGFRERLEELGGWDDAEDLDRCLDLVRKWIEVGI